MNSKTAKRGAVFAVLTALCIFRSSTAAFSEDFMTGEVGDILSFGEYEQDADENDGSEPIEWIILEKSSGELLLVSRCVLDIHEYFYPGTADCDSVVTWENSDLRTWLADGFAEEAFSDRDWTRLLDMKCENENRTREGLTAALDETKDKIAVMSYGELLKWFPQESDRITDFSERSAETDSESVWWLRTTDGGEAVYAVRSEDGKVGTVSMINQKYGIRPMIRISMYQNDSGTERNTEDPELISRVQKKLVELGYSLGETDGIAGQETTAAVIQYQMDMCLPVSGVITEMTAASLGF